MVTQLAREFGAYVIGTGRAADRQKALDFGAQEFVDLDNDALEDAGGVDLVFDVIGGDIAKRSAGLIRGGGTLVTIAGPRRHRGAGTRPGFCPSRTGKTSEGCRGRSTARWHFTWYDLDRHVRRL